MKMYNLPVSERPVEKAVNSGVRSLSNVELLTLLINTGSRDESALELATRVISTFPEGISQLGEAKLEQLTAIKGIGDAKGTRLLAAFELSKRMSTAMPPKRLCVRNNEDVARLFMEELRYEKKEHFIVVLLNTKGEVVDIDRVSMGELSSTVVHPREVFIAAVRKHAASIILVHNHPSGDPEPSRHDVETTKRLVECGRLMGIAVLDHIIIGNGKYRSFKALEII